METVLDLGTLYKKAIETFSDVSNQKLQFYNRIITQLIVGLNKINKRIKNKQDTLNIWRIIKKIKINLCYFYKLKHPEKKRMILWK